jgi:hypothetical protein
MKPIRSIAFVINAGKPGAVGLADELIGEARAKGVDTGRAVNPTNPLPAHG